MKALREDEARAWFQQRSVKITSDGYLHFMVPESGDYIVATSHDETTCVLGHTQQIHAQILAEPQPWNPREDQEWYFRRIGNPGK
jgi:hypothetical protein